jgi:hypothetical protein
MRKTLLAIAAAAALLPGLRNPYLFKSCQDAPRERTEIRGKPPLVMRI